MKSKTQLRNSVDDLLRACNPAEAYLRTDVRESNK